MGECRRKLRIVLIGGGSYSWTPKFVTDIVLEPGLAGSTIVLQDINPDANNELAQYCRLVVEKADADIKIETETDLRVAAKDADFVLLTISTGGLDAMAHDIEIPAKYGIMQSVGDTVGPGGVFRALRNIPVVVDIAKTVESVAPTAWFLNYTNPMTTLTRAINLTTSLPTLGLCHELFGVMDRLAKILGVDKEDMVPVVGGVNHLIWILELTANGRDLLAELKQYWAANKDRIMNFDPQQVAQDPFGDRMAVKLSLLDIYDVLPAAGDRHVAEFFPHFLAERANYGADYGVGLTTIPQRRENLAKAQQRIRHLIANPEEIPIEQSNEAASHIIAEIAAGREAIHIVNIPNRGQMDCLPREAIVETMGVVGPNGARGIAVGHIPAPVAAILNRHVANQEMTVEAALTGNRKLAFQAMLNDPLLQGLTTNEAWKMFDELMEAHKNLLPQF